MNFHKTYFAVYNSKFCSEVYKIENKNYPTDIDRFWIFSRNISTLFQTFLTRPLRKLTPYLKITQLISARSFSLPLARYLCSFSAVYFFQAEPSHAKPKKCRRISLKENLNKNMGDGRFVFITYRRKSQKNRPLCCSKKTTTLWML